MHLILHVESVAHGLSTLPRFSISSSKREETTPPHPSRLPLRQGIWPCDQWRWKRCRRKKSSRSIRTFLPHFRERSWIWLTYTHAEPLPGTQDVWSTAACARLLGMGTTKMMRMFGTRHILQVVDTPSLASSTQSISKLCCGCGHNLHMPRLSPPADCPTKWIMDRIESLLTLFCGNMQMPRPPTCEVDDIHADGILVENSSVPRQLCWEGMKLLLMPGNQKDCHCFTLLDCPEPVQGCTVSLCGDATGNFICYPISHFVCKIACQICEESLILPCG